MLPDLNGDDEDENGNGNNILPYLNVEYLAFLIFIERRIIILTLILKITNYQLM